MLWELVSKVEWWVRHKDTKQKCLVSTHVYHMNTHVYTTNEKCEVPGWQDAVRQLTGGWQLEPGFDSLWYVSLDTEFSLTHWWHMTPKEGERHAGPGPADVVYHCSIPYCCLLIPVSIQMTGKCLSRPYWTSWKNTSIKLHSEVNTGKCGMNNSVHYHLMPVRSHPVTLVCGSAAQAHLPGPSFLSLKCGVWHGGYKVCED
jgi:hypothetical protein